MQHRNDDAVFNFLGLDRGGGDGGSGVAVRKASSSRAHARMRANKKRIATAAAEMSVWSDRRLLGIPHVRWLVVDRAVYMALGLDFKIKGANPEDWGLHPESLAVALEAIDDARSAAIAAVDGMQNKVAVAH